MDEKYVELKKEIKKLKKQNKILKDKILHFNDEIEFLRIENKNLNGDITCLGNYNDKLNVLLNNYKSLYDDLVVDNFNLNKTLERLNSEFDKNLPF